MSSNPTQTEPPEPAGIYVHIPFCERKCPYCDFYSVCDDSLHGVFVDAIVREINLSAEDVGPCDTLYFGGGTPTMLGPAAIGRISDIIDRQHTLLSDAEITIEANPGTVDLDQLKDYRSLGINRINIGVQSFLEENLQFLGRIHTAADARQVLHWARQAGFDEVGLDLIYGIPGQRLQDWRRDLETAAANAPEHISCYTLTLEQGTALERDLRHGLFRMPEEERVAGLFKATGAYLADKGYHRYEVSNFATAASSRSRHNLKYWNFIPYLGFGPSAHSYLPPVRRWNKADLADYMADLESGDLPIDTAETLSREQEMIEAVYLGLRKTEGIDLVDFNNRFGATFQEIFGRAAKELLNRNLLKLENSRCALTTDGLVVMDSIVGQLIDGIPAG